MMTLKQTKNCLKTSKREIKPFIGDYAESNKAMFGKKQNEESSGDINYVLCTLSAASYRFLMKGFFPRSLP